MPRFLSAAWLDELAAAARQAPPLDAGTRLAVGHVVEGCPDGEVRYTFRVEGGTASVEPGEPSGADVTLHEDYATAAAVHRGELSVPRAVAEGRLKVAGDVGAVLRHGAALAPLGAAFEDLRARTTY